MFDLNTLEDLSLLRESVDLECKLAQGQNGQGEIPKDFWSSYSAMANAHGGVVLLGVREKDGEFSIAGLSNAAKLRTDLFNNLNNPAKVSANLLTDAEVEEVVVGGKTILAIRIPQATRKQKPVYLHGQPLGNTYRRLHDGDRKCDDDTVKRMLAEQMEDSRDTRILDKFGMRDLDADSLRAYRNAFAVHRPGHPWLNTDDDEFLRLIGGWCENRANGEAGLTAAGLLMFGQWTSIAEAFPLYFLDYQERPADAQSQTRWLDRIVPDGAWSGNLYDFFRRVIRKLTEDLKVPFVLQGGERVDDTPAHQALREALVNTLIHADYSGRASVLVVKQPSGFVFRNPGMMRVPVAQALAGGASDCRNRTLHQMFLFINLGERAGSGLPKIRSGWEDMGHAVRLADFFEPFEQTTLKMTWGHGFTGVLTETPEKTPEKTPWRILDAMKGNAEITVQELAELLGKSESAINRAIRKLRDAGQIRRIGGDKGGRWDVLP
ncbi:MAG: winged helix-turn-helix transcriptional regulator [Rhodoferax sp.]|nr:RNA-binding domain-containing protein [Rhodoferax sp.]MDP3653585.1 winged helix-turn-helix transcriptional regulator [Rhodoferax sp.]